MAKLSKEQKAYLDGMAFALKVAKESGIEGLEEEIKFRGITNAPLNVSAKELTVAARARAHEELLFVATASAATLADHIKMPPSRVLDYLKEFNHRVDIYRKDPDAFREAQQKLDRNLGLNEVCKSYVMEEEEDGK